MLVVARSTRAHDNAGGMERVYALLVQHLIKCGYSVDLVTTAGAPESQLKEYASVRFVPCARRSHGRYSALWWLYTTYWALRDRGTYRIVLSISSAGLGHVLLSSRRTRSFVQCHGTALSEARSALRGRLRLVSVARAILHLARLPRELLAYRATDKVIAVSRAVEDDLLKFPYKVDGTRLVVIENGVERPDSKVDREAVRRRVRIGHGFDERDPVLIYFGRVSLDKGCDVAVEVLRRLPAEFRLVVCGSGEMEEDLRGLVNSTGLAHRVLLTGRLDQARLREELLSADVALLPSRRDEGLSLSMLEAIASGLRVVGSEALRCPVDLRGFVFRSGLDLDVLVENCHAAVASQGVVELPEEYVLERSLERYEDLLQGKVEA